MRTFMRVHANRNRFPLTLAGVLLLMAMAAWAVTPVEQAKLLADDGAAGDFFGYSVALSGDTALIGAFRDDHDVKGVDSGSAYVFTSSGTAWSQQAKLLAADGAANDTFGGEKLGLSSTGMGCYFDDLVHQLLGLDLADDTWQSLYHFTVGGALVDERLTTLPAYGHLPSGRNLA